MTTSGVVPSLVRGDTPTSRRRAHAGSGTGRGRAYFRIPPGSHGTENITPARTPDSLTRWCTPSPCSDFFSPACQVAGSLHDRRVRHVAGPTNGSGGHIRWSRWASEADGRGEAWVPGGPGGAASPVCSVFRAWRVRAGRYTRLWWACRLGSHRYQEWDQLMRFGNTYDWRVDALHERRLETGRAGTLALHGRRPGWAHPNAPTSRRADCPASPRSGEDRPS